MMRSLALLALAPLAMAFAPSLAPGAVTTARASATFRATQRPAAASLRMGKGIDFPALDGTDMRIGIVTTRWNSEVVDKLRDGAKKTLLELGVKEEDIVEFVVPGAWELPVAARYMALTQKVAEQKMAVTPTVDAVVPMGVLIKGDTDHYDMIKDAATAALMDLQVSTGLPILCGILGCHTMEQAEARATGDFNHGVWWAKTAVEMATLRNTQLGKTGKKKQVGFGMFSEEDIKNLEKSPSEKNKVGGFF